MHSGEGGEAGGHGSGGSGHGSVCTWSGAGPSSGSVPVSAAQSSLSATNIVVRCCRYCHRCHPLPHLCISASTGALQPATNVDEVRGQTLHITLSFQSHLSEFGPWSESVLCLCSVGQSAAE